MFYFQAQLQKLKRTRQSSQQEFENRTRLLRIAAICKIHARQLLTFSIQLFLQSNLLYHSPPLPRCAEKANKPKKAATSISNTATKAVVIFQRECPNLILKILRRTFQVKELFVLNKSSASPQQGGTAFDLSLVEVEDATLWGVPVPPV